MASLPLGAKIFLPCVLAGSVLASVAGAGAGIFPATFAPLAVTDSPAGTDTVLFNAGAAAPIFVDADANGAVARAVNDLADDFARVTSVRPEVEAHTPPGKSVRIIVGTLGGSKIVDQLAAAGKLDINGISGQWESCILQVVKNPLPGVDQALVIAGSDRRGTIYGVYQLSQLLGVSPWYWWADVPVPKKQVIALRGGQIKQGPPGVKYRGIFLNDEDWGLNVWAAKTFDPQFNNIGPKTYAKVFELMLRLRLNCLWPAMHLCSTSFGEVPENAALADKYGIVIGSSHCEPMLYNNISWNEKTRGRWNYELNRQPIYDIWRKTAQERGQYEAIWTLGIRGIHDRGMETPPNDLAGKIRLVKRTIQDQRGLLDEYVNQQWGPVAQCFIPYKEVLPIYDAGLPVPDDVTLVWVDDNFGYLRRLSNPSERRRSGGSGVYWHLSYYGPPHSYTWINTTAPALMWEELHKAWENDARQFWIINVGDLKPAEIGIDYFSRLAWDPADVPLGAQRGFLQNFVTRNFGGEFAAPMTDLLMEYYRLGTVRKPELMEREWALSLSAGRAAQLTHDYQDLLDREKSLAGSLPASLRDAYTEMVGFPAGVLGDSGLIFMADREIAAGRNVTANESEMIKLRSGLAGAVENYNRKVAGGKWNRMMPGLETDKNIGAWNSQVRWPRGERTPGTLKESGEQGWRDAATADRMSGAGGAHWAAVEGLGASGRAMALEPAGLASSWNENDTNAPAMEFDFPSKSEHEAVVVSFMPTFRIYPGMRLRVAVGVDDQPPALLEVPGSSGAESENGVVRSSAVQNNCVNARIPLPGLAVGKHTLKIRAVDPGVVIDTVSLPEQ